jgi:RNA polymerase sigma factor for flagellar operon FliA
MESYNLTPHELDLVEQYLGLGISLARRMATARHMTDVDPLMSAAGIGVLRAIRSYNPEAGKSMASWVYQCCHSEILDELRKTDHLPRSRRRKLSQHQAAISQLADTLGHTPTNADLADAGLDHGPSEPQIRTLLEGIHERLMQRRSRSPSVEESAAFREATKSLSLLHQTVLYLRFFHDRQMHEIAATLNISESRVSQILRMLMEKLKTPKVYESLLPDRAES